MKRKALPLLGYLVTLFLSLARGHEHQTFANGGMNEEPKKFFRP